MSNQTVNPMHHHVAIQSDLAPAVVHMATENFNAFRRLTFCLDLTKNKTKPLIHKGMSPFMRNLVVDVYRSSNGISKRKAPSTSNIQEYAGHVSRYSRLLEEESKEDLSEPTESEDIELVIKALMQNN